MNTTPRAPASCPPDDARTRIVWREHAALCFHVLAHLNLGRDAASLHDPGLAPRPWVDALLAAYRDARARLRLQFVGLETGDHGELRAWFERPPNDLTDPPGRALLTRFRAALAAERERGACRPPPALPERERDALLRALAVLRGALYERVPGGPPALTILDCPALGWCGRAAPRGRERVVAVALARPIEHVICQVFHEEVHPVTDPAVLAGVAPGVQYVSRDTRSGSPGFALHQALEVAAVEAGQAIIEARAPGLRTAYARWRARFGVD